MCDKMAISAHILKIVENDPFLRLQMTAKEMFNRHQFFYADKRYVKIKLMQNEMHVKSQRSYGFLITKNLIFGFQILDLKVHFSAFLILVHN